MEYKQKFKEYFLNVAIGSAAVPLRIPTYVRRVINCEAWDNKHIWENLSGLENTLAVSGFTVGSAAFFFASKHIPTEYLVTTFTFTNGISGCYEITRK